jgi:hypothetical protein
MKSKEYVASGRQAIRDTARDLGYYVSFQPGLRTYAQAERFDHSLTKGLGYVEELVSLSEEQLRLHIISKVTASNFAQQDKKALPQVLSCEDIKRIAYDSGCYALFAINTNRTGITRTYVTVQRFRYAGTRYLGKIEALTAMNEDQLRAFIASKFEGK